MVLIGTKLLKLPRALCIRELTLHTSGCASSRLSFWDGLFWMGGTVGAVEYFKVQLYNS